MTIYKDDLERVYALIEDEQRWTQGAYAKDAAGEPFYDEDGYIIEDESTALRNDAACWCLWGAAYKCGIVTTHESPRDRQFVEALGFKWLTDPNDFNDSHTHAEVLDLLRNAIERAPVRP